MLNFAVEDEERNSYLMVAYDRQPLVRVRYTYFAMCEHLARRCTSQTKICNCNYLVRAKFDAHSLELPTIHDIEHHAGI